MNFRELILDIAGRLMKCPAAPYYEERVRRAALDICAEHGLAASADRFGNLLVTLDRAPRSRPLVLSAHLDHPGFEIVSRLSPKRFSARFLGGVPPEYFVEGVPVRLLPGADRAVLGKKLSKEGSAEKRFELRAHSPVAEKPTHAVWELKDFAVRGELITGRACDDLGGATALLAAMIALKRSRAAVRVIGVLSRAEEVGFHGALALLENKGIPRNSLVISLETSMEMPPVKMGKGVIIRTGDRASVFDSGATRFLAETAAGLGKKQTGFAFQRALMSGGTCEGSAYQEYGFQTGAVCVALGNYHNRGPKSKIAEEFVHAGDVEGMAQLLAEAARQMPRFEVLTGRLKERLRRLAREGVKELGRRKLPGIEEKRA